jgi:photosystem II stability/assembly factor-like uncharacterized protein
MRLQRSWSAALAVALALAPAAFADDAVKITSDTFGGLQARALGPATMSGRIAAIDAVAADPLTIYVGAATGGVWKSANGGITFKPVFDDYAQAIGALRVDPTNPKTVWVGTGESWVRNSVSIGDGVYKSIDGGDHWTNVGLKDSERIARIQVDPKHPDTVYVCATGRLWSSGGDRGVWKTADGGKSWENVLKVDADTGCSDLSMDPQEPGTLYAGMWQFRRSPDFFNSGGKGSGLYKSTDAGKSWKKLTAGLPAGEDFGRVGVSVAPSRASVVYALVERGKRKTALYRSDDSGASFTEVNSSFNVQVRPFYFCQVFVDPNDYNRIYKPGLTLTFSEDGGQSFTSPFLGDGFGSGPHSDHHAMWIDPRNSSDVLLGTDGGLYLSHDRASHWIFAKNLPVGQFYHVVVDNQDPYKLYGGLQDNSSWVGPSAGWGGVKNSDWIPISGGDGFWTFPDLADPNVVYTEIQGGEATRVDLATGESKDIKPAPGKGDPDYRFNWNAGFVFSPSDPGTLYLGSQFLFRSRDRGESWERISPDLTSNDKNRQRQKQSGGLSIDNSTAENNTTIYSIGESPKNHDVVWAGTDDGNVQLTRDGGKSWTNLIDKIPGAPKGAWVSRVQPSRFDEATAFVAIDDHRRGDMKPYLWRTRDFGATWESLVTPELDSYVWVVLEDTENRDLLFLGTEWGLWISIDGGKQWARFKGGIPAKVAVHDLAIQPREGDLAIATHGRGIYILDDLTPLRKLTAETLGKDVAFVPSRPAKERMRPAIGSWFSGNDEFIADNPAEEASIVYWLKKRHVFGDLKLEVYDRDGKLLTTLPGSKRLGLNRVPWPMRMKPPKVPPASSVLFGGFEGPRYPEGTYRVKMIKGKDTYESTVELVADPRNPHTAADRKAKQDTDLRLYADTERLGYVGDQLVAVKDAANARADKSKAVEKQGRALAKAADDFRNSFVATGDGYIGGDEKLREKLGRLYGNVLNYEGAPSPSQLEQLATLEAEVGEIEKKFADFKAKQVDPVNAALAKAKLDPIPVATFDEWKKKDEAGATKPGGAGLDPESLEALAEHGGGLEMAMRFYF